MTDSPGYESLEARCRALEDEATRCTKAEDALRRERDFISAVLATAGALVVVLDPIGRIVLFNRTCERLTGYSFEEVRNKIFWDLLLLPDETENVKGLFAQLTSGRFPSQNENHWVGKDGTRRLIAWSDTALVNSEGKVEFVIATGIDVTEARQAQQALQDSQYRYRRLIQAVTDYAYTVMVRNGCAVETVHGPACVAVTGYSPQDFRDNPYLWIQMVPEEDRGRVEGQAARLLEGGRANPIEHRIIRKDGAVRWVRNTPAPYFDEHGQLISYDGLVQDITEQRQAEEALRESEANYRLLFTADADAIIIVDADTKKISDANDAALWLYGYDRDEFLRLSAAELSAEPEKTMAHIEEVASGQLAVVSPGTVQRLHKKKDGLVFPVEISAGVYTLKNRRMVCAIIRDITERRQVEQALKASRDELELQVRHRAAQLVKVNEALQGQIAERKQLEQGLEQREKRLYEEERRMQMLKFANDVALKLMHELRNPLLSIGGFSRRIATHDFPEERLKAYTQVIFEESMKLEAAINHVLSHLTSAMDGL